MSKLLVTDDDVAICRTLKLHYEDLGHQVLVAHSPDAAMPLIAQESPDAVISDVRMPGRDGISMLKEIQDRYPNLPVIIMTAFHDMEATVTAMQAGAVDYLPKPLDVDELDDVLARALNRGSEIESRVIEVSPVTAASGTIIGASKVMKDIFKQIALVAGNPVTVLVQGESGSGKELVARAIHDAGPTQNKMFMAINCAALVENLLESEMFGHERGAFTGAVNAYKGKAESVGEGTLFLDEISEISPSMQSKLLRLIEAREFSPVGSSKILRCGARFIAATNRNLEKEVAAGRFREDLYYRLNVVTINLPALRERREDIPELVNYLLSRIGRDLGRKIHGITQDAMGLLQAYDWPGNVRELDNILMKASVMVRGRTLSSDVLPPLLKTDQGARNASTGEQETGDSDLSLKALERSHIERVLRRTGWHKGKACEILGISRPRLERRIKEFDLRP